MATQRSHHGQELERPAPILKFKTSFQNLICGEVSKNGSLKLSILLIKAILGKFVAVSDGIQTKLWNLSLNRKEGKCEISPFGKRGLGDNKSAVSYYYHLSLTSIQRKFQAHIC